MKTRRKPAFKPILGLSMAFDVLGDAIGIITCVALIVAMFLLVGLIIPDLINQ